MSNESKKLITLTQNNPVSGFLQLINGNSTTIVGDISVFGTAKIRIKLRCVVDGVNIDAYVRQDINTILEISDSMPIDNSFIDTKSVNQIQFELINPDNTTNIKISCYCADIT